MVVVVAVVSFGKVEYTCNQNNRDLMAVVVVAAAVIIVAVVLGNVGYTCDQ